MKLLRHSTVQPVSHANLHTFTSRVWQAWLLIARTKQIYVIMSILMAYFLINSSYDRRDLELL